MPRSRSDLSTSPDLDGIPVVAQGNAGQRRAARAGRRGTSTLNAESSADDDWGGHPDVDAGELPKDPGSPRDSDSSKFPDSASASDSPNVPATNTPLAPAELIERHERGVWRYLRMLGCDSSTADDLTQETFLRVLRRDNFVQHSDAATSSYLRRTAYNLLISMHRKHSRMHTTPDAGAVDELWNRWAGKDLAGDLAVDVLRDCLAKVSERARLALKMRFAKNSSRAEIAEALGISEHGARNLMQRAKEKLRDCVQGELMPSQARQR
ncbi:MAG: sigma-70 family RNA polymerase sigma factor [Planctomycetota bacterium]